MRNGQLPKNVIADAGYGSEENYEYLLEEEITAFVKYNTYHKEKRKKRLDDITKSQYWAYNPEEDRYYCKQGRPLIFMCERKTKSENGYEGNVRVYECLNCSGCPQREKCVKSENEFANRTMQVNLRLNELKAQAKKLLDSDEGLKMRSQRPIEVESVFGNIKGNYDVRRFLLRGLEKVTTEWGLISIAHNMRKITADLIG